MIACKLQFKTHTLFLKQVELCTCINNEDVKYQDLTIGAPNVILKYIRSVEIIQYRDRPFIFLELHSIGVDLI